MKHKQRIIAVILSLLMLLSALPAYAEDGKKADTFDKWKFCEELQQNTQPTEIHFVEELPEGAEKLADISQKQPGHIYLYQDKTDGSKYYVFNTKGNKIYFPENSSRLFAREDLGVRNLTSLTFKGVNTEQVTDMRQMFWHCSDLRKLDVTSFDTRNVTDMGEMFKCCASLSTLDLTSFDIGAVGNMCSMFEGCEALETLTWDRDKFKTDKVTNMHSMFKSCFALRKLDVSKFNTGEVTDMFSMFEDCSSLKELDLTSFDTAKVTYMYGMFLNCKDLTRIWASEKFVTTAIPDPTNEGNDMFHNCSSLKGGKGTGYDSDHTNSTYARIDGGESNPGYFSDKNDTPLTEHSITVNNDGNGTASADVNQAAAGTRVTLTATPNSGYHFKEWQVVSPADLTITENTFTMPDENVTLKAVFQQNATPPTPFAPSVPTSPTEPAEYKPVSLETSLNGKTYSIEGTEEALNGAVKLSVTMDEQGKTRMNFLDKEGNKVKTKGAVKLTMPIKEGMRPPYRIKVNGKYTTYGEENGNFVLILRPMENVEMKRLIDTVDGKEVLLEGTREALNGATKIQVEKKPNGSLVLHLYNEQGKEIKSKGYVFVEFPIPEGKKPPYKVTVGGKSTTFEETERGSVAFGVLIQ